MKQRKYNIWEIDLMRAALKERRRFAPIDGSSVEDELRTHMINGSTVEDLQRAVHETEDMMILIDLRAAKAKKPDATICTRNSRGELLTV